MWKKNKKLCIVFIVCGIVLVMGISSVLFYTQSLKPMSSKGEEIAFEIEEGQSSDIVLSNLKKQGLIHNTIVAKFYMRNQNLGDLKFGAFLLDTSWDLKTILKTLNDSKMANQNMVKITFREGIWAKDIAASLQDKLGVDQNELLSLWNDEAYIRSLMKTYPFLTEDIFIEGTRVKLEGYLFPETYFFEKDVSAKEITETFLDHFQTIYERHLDDLKKSSMSMQEIITLASMVQYEASTKEDMGMIAGVFFNRLADGMKLQSSVTVCYALYDNLTSGEDCEVNPELDSPYNTYMKEGLPIGPILNPGEEAIDAVLHPTDNDYMYFVADIYGDGKVHYAKTYEEQLANQEKFNLNK